MPIPKHIHHLTATKHAIFEIKIEYKNYSVINIGTLLDTNIK